ncbi:peptide deformylase [Streptomyces antibioticus]|uniref:peptide deformylase n=1 Tax=Streptomyces antibioticus TaxID=1890 RepID=UPI00224E0FA1|nr:peptide deformylase [Streptomyces antibioticus]MCX5173813.1 peptide deformylase [Streptomyces antibioticus]
MTKVIGAPPPGQGADAIVLLNPRVTEAAVETDEQFEGCLSLFNVRGMVPRPLRITVETTNLDGTRTSKVYERGLARLIQHEIDHLDGKLYTARMRPGVDPISVEQYRQTGLIYSCQASAQADRLWRHQVHEARGLSGAERGARQ